MAITKNNLENTKRKFNKIVHKGRLPLSFLYLHLQNENSNHELRFKPTFNSKYFNNDRMNLWINPISTYISTNDTY